MAHIRLDPKPDEWSRWKLRFELFRVASGLAEEGDGRQVSTLLYYLGKQAEDFMTSAGIQSEDRKVYRNVLDTLDKFFCKNVIFERARFNLRSQLEGESAEECIMALYSLVEDCDYKEWKEEMIRDRLMVGIRDAALSQRLQMDSELTCTLEKAKKAIRQKVAVREQSELLCGSKATKDVDQVQSTTGKVKQQSDVDQVQSNV